MVIVTPYARPFGELCKPEPQIEAYPVFVLETRIFPFIASHFPRLVPYLSSRTINDEMRLVLNLDWEGLPATLTPEEEALIQDEVDSVTQKYPEYANLVGTQDLPPGETLTSIKKKLGSKYKFQIWDNQLLVDLSRYPVDYRIRYQDLVNRIYNLPSAYADRVDYYEQ